MIEQRHEIPLTTAISKSVPGKGSLVQSLYHECESLLHNQPTKTPTVSKTRVVLQTKDGDQVTAIVTDEATGLFVQLTGTFSPDGSKKDGPFLVFGKKYLEEAKIPQLSNTGVKLWQ